MKKRIDELLVERGLAASVGEASALVMAGEVLLGDHRVDKAGLMVNSNSQLSLKAKSRYVSRAGDKLASVIEPLGLKFEGKTILDVGSSTGGFTDVALQHGAVKVWCVDVGTAQLAYKLRQDPRVMVMEKTDVRDLENSQPFKADMAVVDVSFVKLDKVLPSIAKLINPGGQIAAMMKPQFEADKATADRFEGVISDEAMRQEIINSFRSWVQSQFEILGEADSGVAGIKGNRERFFVLSSRTLS